VERGITERRKVRGSFLEIKKKRKEMFLQSASCKKIGKSTFDTIFLQWTGTKTLSETRTYQENSTKLEKE